MKTTYWFDVFQNAMKIRRVRSPAFIFHGTEDLEVPFEHGETLYASCPPELAYEPWWVQEAGHNDIEINHRAMYLEQLSRFLKALEMYFDNDRNWKKGGEFENEHENDSNESGAAELLLPAKRNRDPL